MKKFFRAIKDRNNKFWAKFYSPETKIAAKGKLYIIIPAIIIAVGIVLVSIPSVGLNLSLEFTGGQGLEISSYANMPTSEKAQIENYFKSNNIKYRISTPNTDGNYSISITFASQNIEKVTSDIENIVGTDVDITVISEVSPTASDETMFTVLIAVLLSLVVILIYVLIRFKITSGVSAVVALIHDVLVTIALCAIFRIEIGSAFIAAMITIVVYSINNTIVQFDRIRSKEKAIKKLGGSVPVEQIVDTSVKEVFARTIGTMATTLVPVLVLCCVPVPLIRQFSLPIMFGLIAGTFSTLFVTTGLYVRFENYKINRKRQAAKKQKNATNNNTGAVV